MTNTSGQIGDEQVPKPTPPPLPVPLSPQLIMGTDATSGTFFARVEHHHQNDQTAIVVRLIFAILIAGTLVFVALGVKDWGPVALSNAGYYLAGVITGLVSLLIRTGSGVLVARLGPYSEIAEVLVRRREEITAHTKKHAIAYGFAYLVIAGAVTLAIKAPLVSILETGVNVWFAAGAGAVTVALIMMPAVFWDLLKRLGWKRPSGRGN